MSGAVSAADAAGRRELQFALLQTAAAKFWLRNLVLGLKAKEERLLLSFKVALPRDRKKTGLWLVTWKADMEIKIPAALCLQTEAERVQQQGKRLLQWCRVLEMKSLGLLHFESPVYKILAPRTSALHWLSNLYS